MAVPYTFKRGNCGARDAETYAQLWAAIVDTVTLEDVLEWRPTIYDQCWWVGIPAVIEAKGTVAMAAYLIIYGFENEEIGDAPRVGS